jgi:hypothetical protein
MQQALAVNDQPETGFTHDYVRIDGQRIASAPARAGPCC